MKFNISKDYWHLDIEKIEEKHNAEYIGDFSIRNANGNYTDSPVSVFYVENPDVEKGHSHYFGIYQEIINDIYKGVSFGPLYITKADSAFDTPLEGIIADDGEVVISCYRHDFRMSTDGSVGIDGGRSEYIRYIGNIDNKTVKVGINKNTLYIID